MDSGGSTFLYFPPVVERASTSALKEPTSPTLDPVVLSHPSVPVLKVDTLQIESCDTSSVDVLAKDIGLSLITASEGDLCPLASPPVHTSLNLIVSPGLLSSTEEPFFALSDAYEGAIITTRVSSAYQGLQISRWYFLTVWDTGLLELLQFLFDGLSRSFSWRQFLQGILHLYDAMMTSCLPIAQLTSAAVDLAHDSRGTQFLVPRSLHSLDFPCLLLQVHMANLVFQIWQEENVLVVSLISGAWYLPYDTVLVHPGSFLTCDTSVFLCFRRSLFFSACLRPERNSPKSSSWSFYSSSLLERYLDDTSMLVPLIEEEAYVVVSSLSVRVDSFDNKPSIFRSGDSSWSNLHQFWVTFVFDIGRLQDTFCWGLLCWFCSFGTLGVCLPPGSKRGC